MEDRRRDVPPAHIGRCIVVPVANPASVRPLLELAACLVDIDGRIELLTVLPPEAGADAYADAWQGMAAAEALATRLGVHARGEVRASAALADTVLDVIRERGASLVVMGWRGASSTTDVFGRLIDHVVGRSAVPLAVVRLGAVSPDRVLLPVSADHLLPGGSSGLLLAVALAERLRAVTPRPTTLLRTGSRELALPDAVSRLADRVHHDPRRTHRAVAALAGASDVIVAAVAPTVSGLRAATTHLAWAAPDATLLVAIDVGPRGEHSLTDAVSGAGRPAPAHEPAGGRRCIRVVVTVRLPDDHEVTPQELERILARGGRTDQLMAWWPAGDPNPRVRITVELTARDPDSALSRVMATVDAAPELSGAEITYELDRDTGSGPIDGEVGISDRGLSVLADEVDAPAGSARSRRSR